MKLWSALTVRFHPGPGGDSTAVHDLASVVLDGHQVTAIQEADDRWVVFFATPRDRDAAAAALRSAAPVGFDVEPLDVPDEDWARRSQQDLTPVQVGKVTITPPWAAEHAAEAAAAAGVTVVIQPSMGFGTGHHATTRLCTALLQQLDLEGRTVLDVGTGSGVLALVARALGSPVVVAVDDDPDAIESARENLGLNGVTGGIELRVGDFRGLSISGADVVVANLTGALLERGAEALVRTVKPGGALVISGVTLEEEAAVLSAFEPWMTLVDRRSEDEWIGAILIPNSRVSIPAPRSYPNSPQTD